MSQRLLLLRASAVALVVALTIGAGRAARSQTSNSLPSPEEIAIQLRPYLLQNDDLPAGYTVSDPASSTPATRAFNDTSDEAPASVLAAFEAEGFLVGASQTISPPSSSRSTDYGTGFYLDVFDTPEHAQDFVDGRTFPFIPDNEEFAAVPDAESFGDDSVTYHVIERHTGGSVTASYAVRWSRGVLGFEIITSAPVAKEQLTLAETLAEAADGRAAAQSPIDLGSPTITPPTDDLGRLQSLLRMKSIVVPPSAIPAGYVLRSSIPAVVVSSTLTDPDPWASLTELDVHLQRLAALNLFYRNADDQTKAIRIAFFEDATADDAHADFADEYTTTSPKPQPMQSPLALGDESALVDETQPNSQGATIETMWLVFRHGPLLIGVYISGPSGTPDLATLESLAQAVDAAYQQSAYAQ